jgi:hypothetical protein
MSGVRFDELCSEICAVDEEGMIRDGPPPSRI